MSLTPSIRIVDNTQLPWFGVSTVTEDLFDNAVQPFEIGESDSSSAGKFHHPGSDTELQMVEVRVTPNERVEQHAHAADEIMYILAGEMHFGARVLTPGMSAYIRGDTLYGFRAGPKGARFLNFRAFKDLTYFSKETFLERRKLVRGAEESDA